MLCFCRNATHSHVVQLLRGSGTRPTLVVSSAPQDMTTLPGGGHRGSTTHISHPGHGSVKKHSKEFKEKMEQVLLEDERRHVIHQLTKFSQNK